MRNTCACGAVADDEVAVVVTEAASRSKSPQLSSSSSISRYLALVCLVCFVRIRILKLQKRIRITESMYQSVGGHTTGLHPSLGRQYGSPVPVGYYPNLFRIFVFSLFSSLLLLTPTCVLHCLVLFLLSYVPTILPFLPHNNVESNVVRYPVAIPSVAAAHTHGAALIPPHHPSQYYYTTHAGVQPVSASFPQHAYRQDVRLARPESASETRDRGSLSHQLPAGFGNGVRVTPGATVQVNADGRIVLSAPEHPTPESLRYLVLETFSAVLVSSLHSLFKYSSSTLMTLSLTHTHEISYVQLTGKNANFDESIDPSIVASLFLRWWLERRECMMFFR